MFFKILLFLSNIYKLSYFSENIDRSTHSKQELFLASEKRPIHATAQVLELMFVVLDSPAILELDHSGRENRGHSSTAGAERGKSTI